MKLGYNLNSKGKITSISSQNIDKFQYQTDGTEPFSLDDYFDWQKDLSTGEWIFKPIIMVPEYISKLQATKHMLNINRHAELMAIIDADETGETRLLYDAAHQLDRSSDMVNQLGAAMGFSPEELDDLFIEANKILV